MSTNQLWKKLEMYVQFGGANGDGEFKDYRGGLVCLDEIIHPCDTCDEDCDYCCKSMKDFDLTGTYRVTKKYGMNYFNWSESKIDVSDEVVTDDFGGAMQLFRQWVLEMEDYLTKEQS